MLLYIIRHGETEWNVNRRLQGRVDIPLNKDGIRLAEITAKKLDKVPFSMIYTSPLKRAKQTANILKQTRNIPVIEDERIIEISFGIYEGLCCSKEHYNIPDPDFMNFFEKPEMYVAPKGAETFEELRIRTSYFIEELMHNEHLKDEVILVSTHGAALRGILSYVYGIGIEQFWKGGVHPNCAVSIVEIKDGKAIVLEEGKIYYDS